MLIYIVYSGGLRGGGGLTGVKPGAPNPKNIYV